MKQIIGGKIPGIFVLLTRGDETSLKIDNQACDLDCLRHHKTIIIIGTHVVLSGRVISLVRLP